MSRIRPDMPMARMQAALIVHGLRRWGGAAALLGAALLAGCGGADKGAAEPTEGVKTVLEQRETNLVVDATSSALRLGGDARVEGGAGSAQRWLVGGPEAQARFEPALPKDGHYEVFARWPQRLSHAGMVTVTIEHADGRHVQTLDQSGGGEWRSLGSYRFSAAGPVAVTVAAGSPSGLVLEALRFWYRGAAVPAPAFAEPKLPLGLADREYRARIDMSSGAPPYRFALVEGELPAGVALDAETGTLSGRPARAGDYRFVLGATDRTGRQARQAFSIQVGTTGGTGDSGGRAVQAVSEGRKSILSAGAASPTSGALTSLQSIVSAMPEGTWQRVNLNNFSAAWTPENLRTIYNGGPQPPSKIIMAWSSSAWDSTRGNLFLYGGGHANYRGNDTYLWRGSSQQWERGSLPSEMVQLPLGAWNAIDGADKAPASAHTYDNTLYLPILDRFLVLGGAADPNGGHFLTQSTPTTVRNTGPYLFDPSRAHPDRVGGTTGSHVQRAGPFPEVIGGNMWQNRESWLNASSQSTPPSESFVNSCTGYAEENGRDVVYVRTQHRIFRYEIFDIAQPALDRWTLVGRYFFGGSGGQGTCAYDPTRRFFVSTYESLTQPFIFWNMATPGSDNRDILVTPSDPGNTFMPLVSSRAINLGMCSLERDPVRGDFKLWCGDGRIWSLTPPATATATGWTINMAPTPTGPVPSESTGTGILGKWDYVPNLDVFMGLADPELGNIWIYKPVGWVAPWVPVNLPPTVALSTPVAAARFTVGTDIALAANASDDVSVALVEFFANGTKIGESSGTPYGVLWSGAPLGTHVLTARATDGTGLVTTSTSVTIHVDPVLPNNTPPTVSWVSPADGSSVVSGSPVTMEVNAADSDGTVAKVEFFVGGSKRGEALNSPYRFTWTDAPVGAHVLTAIVTDNLGATATTAARTVNVTPGAGGAITVTLQRGAPGAGSVADTYLSTYHRTLNFGANTTMLDERTNYSPLLRFAIFQSEGGPVPNGATINSAVLSVYKATEYDMAYAAHRMLVDWSESAATWNQRLAGVAWATAGANGSGTDFSASADASGAVSWAAGWVNLDVTARVQQFSTGAGGANFGWRLRGTGGTQSALKQLTASEFTGSPAQRPKLVITYGGTSTNVPPTVAMTAPANGANFVAGSVIAITANAADSDGSVARVEYFAGSTKIGESTAAPHRFDWSGAAIGSHVLTARATDNSGASTTSEAVTVAVAAPTNVPPSAALTAPAEGASFVAGSTVTLTATASDGDGSVALVEFFANGVKVGERNASPYTVNWSNGTPGVYALTVRATDSAGATTTSAVVNVSLTTPSNLLPTVSWVSPGDGAAFQSGTPITIEVNAADTDGSISLVEFFAGGVKIGQATQTPYRFVWSGAPLGPQSLTVVVTDNGGATASTAPRVVNVNAPGGTPTAVTLQRGVANSGAVSDTYLSTFHRTTAWGAAVSAIDERNNYSMLFRFAIFQSEGGPVPNGATITSAVLSLYKSNEYDVGYAAHRVLVDWNESQATWNQRRTGVAWSTAGANGVGTDYQTAADATASVGWSPGWLNLDLTAAVQQMSSGGANFGWRVRSVSGTTANIKRFHTSESTTAPTLRPRLVITYQ